MRIYGDTGGYRGLQGATGGYKGLQGVTRGYRGLQGITALILLPYYTSRILKRRGHIKGRLLSRFLNFLKNLSSGL